MALMIFSNWTKYTWIAIPGSLLVWIIFLPIYGNVAPGFHVSTELYGLPKPLYGSGAFWFCLILVPLLCVFRDFIWKL
jgi:phospholipid-transporting ATPase